MVNGIMESGWNRGCRNLLCPASFDRCSAMAFNVTVNGVSSPGWMKGCNNHHICNKSDAGVCSMFNDIFRKAGDSARFADCKVVCSQYNNAAVPGGPTGKEYVMIRCVGLLLAASWIRQV